MNRKLVAILKNELDLPDHKIEYIINRKSLVQGLWGVLNAYGIKFNEDNHDTVVEYVQEKLNGDIEREWTENEYNTFILFKPEMSI